MVFTFRCGTPVTFRKYYMINLTLVGKLKGEAEANLETLHLFLG